MKTVPFRCIFVMLAFGLLLGGCGPSAGRQARKGLGALDAGEVEEAAALLSEALEGREEDPEAGALWGALGLALARADRAGPAEEAFRRGVELAPEDFLVHYNYGGLLLREGRFAEAADLFDRAAELAPDRLEPLEFAAAAALRAGDSGRAYRRITEAARLEEHPRVLTSQAVLTADRGDVRAVRELLDRALDEDPAYAPAAYNLAAYLDRVRLDPVQAVHYYERFLGLNPESEFAPGIRERLGVLRERVGRDGSGDPASAEIQGMLDQAERVAAGNPQQAVHLCLRAAAAASRAGRPDLEERALRISVEIAPEQPRGHFALGRFLLKEGRPSEALAAYRDSSGLAPEWFPALMGQAAAAAAARQPEVAREALRRAEALAADDPNRLYEIAVLHQDELGDVGTARRLLRTLLERFPGHPREGDIHERLGR